MGPTTRKGAAATSSSLSEPALAPAPPAPAPRSFGAFQEQARKATTEVVERVLTSRGFNVAEVSEWCDEIGAETVAALAKQHPGYRFAATATIVQLGKGAGVSTASAAAFDPRTDGALMVRWQNQSLLCLVAVFGIAFA